MKFHGSRGTATGAHKLFDTWSATETQPKSEGIPAQHLSDSVPDLRGRVIHVAIHQVYQSVPREVICEVFSAYGEVAEMFQSPPPHSLTQSPSLFIEYEHGRMADKALHALHGLYLYPNDCQLDIRHANLKELQTFYGYSAPRFSEDQLELLQLIQRDLEALSKMAISGMKTLSTGTDLAPTPPSQHVQSVDVCPVLACVPVCMEDQNLERKQHEQQLKKAPTQLQFVSESLRTPTSIILEVESANKEKNIGSLDLVLNQWPYEQQQFQDSTSAPFVALSVSSPILQEEDLQNVVQVENPLRVDVFHKRQPEPPLLHVSNWKWKIQCQIHAPHVLALAPCSSFVHESPLNISDLCGHIKTTPLMLPWDPGTLHCGVTEGGILITAPGLQHRDEIACSLSTSPVPLSIVVLVEPDSGHSDIAIAPVPQVLEDTPVTTLADPCDDTPQDAQGLRSMVEIQLSVNNEFSNTLEQVAPLSQSMLERFRTLQRTSFSPIYENICTSWGVKMEHLVKLDEIKRGLSLELHLLFLAIMRNEAVLRPIIQSATRNIRILQPWDPGLPLFCMDNKLSTIKHGLVVRLTIACGVVCLRGHSVHELFSCNVVIESILIGMAKLVELRPWPSWVLRGMVVLVLRQDQSSWELSALILTSRRRASYTAWIWCCLDNLQYIDESTNLAIPHWAMHIPSLEIWVYVYCHYARVHFQWNISVQMDISSCGFHAILHGRAEVQRHYFCPRVLTDANHNVCISRHIWRGTTHYSELIDEWLLLRSEFGCRSPINIPLFYCVLGQWYIPWTVSLVLVKSGFQDCIAGHESVYGSENFQWTIAWSLGYYFSLSTFSSWLRTGDESSVYLSFSVEPTLAKSMSQEEENASLEPDESITSDWINPQGIQNSVLEPADTIQSYALLGKILADMDITNSEDASLTPSKTKVVDTRIVLWLISVLDISTLETTSYQEQHVFETNFTHYVRSKCHTRDPGINVYRTLQPDSDTHLMDFTCQWITFTNKMVGLHYKIFSCGIVELWIISFRPP